jgi:hypothetical protein
MFSSVIVSYERRSDSRHSCSGLKQQANSLKTPCNVFVLVLHIEHPAYKNFSVPRHKSHSDSGYLSSNSQPNQFEQRLMFSFEAFILHVDTG